MRKDEENIRQMLLCIVTYARLYGFPPSLMELCRMCGYRLSAVRQYIKQLEEDNWITYDASAPESIMIRKARTGMNEQIFPLMECG